MKKVLICSVIFILVAIVYMAGHNSGYKTGFREGWEACEKDASCDWNEWH